eukprot:COSAG06_NODE_10672_length_1639_cov_1.001948_3_plen_158_part_00
MTTYLLSATLIGDSVNLYTVYGTADSPMHVPAAFQVATPFGANTGGANPAFFAFSPDADFDSWLTAGITAGDSAGSLSSIGIDFAAWTADAAMDVPDGAVFWMAPDAAPGGEVAVAQITVVSGSTGEMTAGAQGRSSPNADGSLVDDWQQNNNAWSW